MPFHGITYQWEQQTKDKQRPGSRNVLSFKGRARRPMNWSRLSVEDEQQKGTSKRAKGTSTAPFSALRLTHMDHISRLLCMLASRWVWPVVS